MPHWARHALDLSTGWVERWGVRGYQLAEVLTGIIPVYNVGKQWLPDQGNIFGLSTYVTSTVAGRFVAGGIVALDRDCYVVRVTANVQSVTLPPRPWEVTLFTTQLATYDPYALNAAVHFPFLASPFLRSRVQTLGISGESLARGIVMTGGGPAVLEGPIHIARYHTSATTAQTPHSMELLWDMSDPPFILHQGDVLVVQHTNPTLLYRDSIWANFYWWEQQPGETKPPQAFP